MASIFTKIINREIPAAIVFENDKVIAFKDINPQAPVHILVVPKKEIATVNDIKEEENPQAPVHILVVPKKEIATVNDIKEEDKELIGEVYLAIGKIAADLGIAEEGYRVIANCNEYGGQEVFHIHFHLLYGGQEVFHIHFHLLGGKKLGPLV